MRSPAFRVLLSVSFMFCSQILLGVEYGDTVQYFPQAVAGGGAVTTFSIYNPGQQDAIVKLELIDSNGDQFYSTDVVIPDGGVQTVSIGAGQTLMKVGWARLTASAGQFEATEFFQLTIGGQALPRVGVLPCAPSSSLKFFAYLVKGQTNTGFAVANTSDKMANLTLRRYNSLGSLQGAVTVSLASEHHIARFLNEDPWFAGLENFEGIVELTSTEPVALVMLRSDNALLSAAAVLLPTFDGLAAGSVTTDALADGAVTGPKIGANAVTGQKIANGTITGEDLAADSVAMDKLDATGTGSAGQVLGTDGSSLRWQDDSLKTPAHLIKSGIGYETMLWFKRPDYGNPLAVQTGGGDGVAVVLNAALSAAAVVDGHFGIHVHSTDYPAVDAESFEGTAISALGSIGVWGTSRASTGVVGESDSGYGVHGLSDSGVGVFGISTTGDGLVGRTSGDLKSGIFAVAEQANSYAGYFEGKVNVSGNLSKGGGGFKIDHPLDPENRYLYHSFVESPDMKNVYDGVAQLDQRGEAWVQLPEWFEALNRDFRYQLTPLGAPTILYVASEIQGNRFQIAGGMPGQRVSWQVTGIRQDAFANANRIPVEEVKSDSERGKYLHPQAWGQPREKGVNWARRVELERLGRKPDMPTPLAIPAGDLK